MMGRMQTFMAPGVWELIMERDQYHHHKPKAQRELKRIANHHYRRQLRGEMLEELEAEGEQ